MTPLTITAITNFILSSEIFLLSGILIPKKKDIFSAAWFWNLGLILLGISTLIAGIDHGFIEPLGLSYRVYLERTNWLLLGIMTSCISLTTITQFIPRRFYTLAFFIAGTQLLVYATLIFRVGKFIIVIINYLPIMLLLLIANCIGLRNGTGSWSMIFGILILFIASAIQAIKINIFSPLDHNGLYHIVAMFGVIFLYLGEQKLKTIF